jgi:hypothetical protein
MLEPTQLLLEMRLERHNCQQQWKWKVSVCNCDEICSVLLLVDMSFFISLVFSVMVKPFGVLVYCRVHFSIMLHVFISLCMYM